MHSDNLTVQQRAIILIKSESTMVLSTLDKITKIPWSTPIYFLYSNGSFYFLSSPKSCHVVQAMKAKVAASIFFSKKKNVGQVFKVYKC